MTCRDRMVVLARLYRRKSPTRQIDVGKIKGGGDWSLNKTWTESATIADGSRNKWPSDCVAQDARLEEEREQRG